MRFLNKKSLAAFGALVLLCGAALPALASAAQLKQTSVRLGRLGISAGSGGASDGNDLLVTFKLNTSPTTVAKVDVVFPTGFVVASGTPTVGTTGFPQTPTSITATPGTLTATAASATNDIQVSGITSASLNNTTLYGFTIPAGTITNPGTAGQYNVTVCSQTTSGTAGCASGNVDTSTAAVYVTGASSNGDQVTVTASVAPNFSFSLSGNTDTISQVDPTTIQTSSGVTMSVATNSPLGYTAYVKSKNAALSSASAGGATIGTGTFDNTPDSVAAGTTSYTFVPSTTANGTTANGTIAYDSEYNVADGNHGGSFNGTNFASFVSRSGYSSGDQISLKERVAVDSAIPAANDYTDTLTIVAAGNF